MITAYITPKQKQITFIILALRIVVKMSVQLFAHDTSITSTEETCLQDLSIILKQESQN